MPIVAPHSRRLIAEFPDDGIKCIQKLQSHFANMTFADKSRFDMIFQQVTHNVGEMLSHTLRGSRMHRHYLFQLETATQRIKLCTLF